jgi:RHS repeat-associated protein
MHSSDLRDQPPPALGTAELLTSTLWCLLAGLLLCLLLPVSASHAQTMNEVVPSVVRSQAYPPFIRYSGYSGNAGTTGFLSLEDPFYFVCRNELAATIDSVTPSSQLPNDAWQILSSTCSNATTMMVFRDRYCETPPPPGSSYRGGGPTLTTCPAETQRVCPIAFPTYAALPGGLTCWRDARQNPKQLGACKPGEPCPCVGNPINCGNGNKFEREVDYAAPGSGGLRFERFYNSAAAPVTQAMGIRWRHTWMRTIEVTEPADGRVAITRADGKVLTFIPSGGIWVPDSDVSDRLTRLTNTSNQHIGWDLLVAATEETERYDVLGRLVFVMTRGGLVTTVAYHPVNVYLPVTVTDPFGRQLQLTYAGAIPRLASITDPAGQIIRFRYGGNGAASTMLTEVEYPGTLTRRYRYGTQAGESEGGVAFAPGSVLAAANLLTGVIDERNVRVSTFRYDTQNRAISTERGGATNRYQVGWGSDDTQRTVTDPLGVARIYTFSLVAGMPALTSITGAVCPACGPAARTFDANGNVSSETDWNGFRTTLTFDLARNLETSRTEGLNGNGTVRPETRTLQTEWHPTFRLPTKVTERNSADVALRETTMGYDVRGNLISRSVKDVASNQTRTWTWTHTYSTTIPGLILQTVLDGPRIDVADTTTWTFDPANGNLLSKSEFVNASLSLVTTYGNHDAHGNARTITDPNGIITTLVFDPRQRLTTTTTAGEMTTYAYDAAGLLDRVTQPDGSFLDFNYDGAQRLVRIEDAAGGRIDYTLDAMGNSTGEAVRDVNGTLRQTRSRVFSTLNRLSQEIGALGQVTAMAYDNQGNLISIDGPLTGTADTTTRAFDALNRLVRVTAPDSGQVQTTLNALDQVTQITDPRSLATAYAQNALGNVATQTSPDTGITSRTFDAAGNLFTETDAAGRTVTRTYDALNRTLTEVHVQAGKPTQSLAFTYDQGPNGLGRLTGFTDPSGSTALSYDPRGRLIAKAQITEGRTWTLQHRYDSLGRLDRITYPSGRQVDALFDANGRITALTVNGTPLIGQVTYHPFGDTTGWTLSSAAGAPRAERPRDTDGRISAYTLGAQTRTLTYDAASRIVQLAVPGQTIPVGYDLNDRLTSFTVGSNVRTYSYDLTGNRLTRSGEPYTYPSTSNRLLQVNSTGGTPLRSYAYDASGRPTSDGVNAYAYDTRGRLETVTVNPASPSAKVLFFLFNARGERVMKRTGGPVNLSTHFVYDEAGKLLGEYDSAGNVLQEIVWLGDLPVASLRGAGALEVFYIYPDQIGTPRMVVDVQNRARWRWDLNEPFGGNFPNANPTALGTFVFNLRMPGQYADADSELFYNYFRDYDRFTGRYIQSDPIGLAGGVNLYGYVGGNPLSYADPDGLIAIAPALWWGAAALAAGGTALSVAKPPALPAPSSGTRTPADEAQRRWERNDYHNRCDEQPPPGLDRCSRWRWELNRNRQCKADRDRYTRKWYGASDAGHAEGMRNLDRSIEILQDKIARLCPDGCRMP